MSDRDKLLVIGADGQLGRDLVQFLGTKYEVFGLDLPRINICDRNSVMTAINRVQPSVVIHAAAYTDVDGCEKNADKAMAVNGEGTRNVSQACRATGARMIYYSTDYVFDGQKESSYCEDDTPDPQTVYGRSKLAGEKAVSETVENYAIMRISWVYGFHGHNFVKTMLRLGASQMSGYRAGASIDPLRVVDDQFGNPTWTMDIVRQTADIIAHGHRGMFHATSQNETTWYRFARTIFEYAAMEVMIEPCTTKQFPRPAPRPRRSSLINIRLKKSNSDLMPDYEPSLKEFISTYGNQLVT